MKMMTRVKAISVGSTHDTCTPQSDRKKAPNIHDDCNDEDDFEQRDSRSGALFACLNIFSSCVCCQKCHWAASCCFWFWSLGNSKLIFLFLPNVKSIWCKMCALSFNCRNTRTCEIHHHEVHLSARHSMSGIGNWNHALLLISSPGQLNRWPWYWLTHSLSEWLTFWFQSH